MKTKTSPPINTDYDLDFLINRARKNLKRFFLLFGLYAFLLSFSVLAIVLWGSFLSVFIIATAVFGITLFLVFKSLAKINLADYKMIQGEIVDVLKEATTVRSITGGYGMYVTRKYDAFAKTAIRLTVSIKNCDEIHSYVLDGVTEDHLKYYELKGAAVHIYGTHFPVKLNIDQDKWLCPVCGELNMSEEKNCVNCKEKVLK